MLTDMEIAEKCGLFYPETHKRKDGTKEVVLECCFEKEYRDVLNNADRCCTPWCPFWKPVGATDKVRDVDRKGNVFFRELPEDLADNMMSPEEYVAWFYGRERNERNKRKEEEETKEK